MTKTTLPTSQLHPKYKLAQLLRNKYGEFGVKKGTIHLANFCGIIRLQTVKDWFNIEAGSSKEISHLVLPKVLEYFSLQNESQLFTDAHNALLNNKNQQL